MRPKLDLMDLEAFYAFEFPPNTLQPCSECPWRRRSAPGWLGPMTAQQWIGTVHSDAPIACHMTVTEVDEEGHGDWAADGIRQCRGAAMFRANVCKNPRHEHIETGPHDTVRVFANNNEFLEHHS